MADVSANKRLFVDRYRRRAPGSPSSPRLLGGQALSQAQRLSHASMRPVFLSALLFVIDLLVVMLAAWATLPFSQVIPLDFTTLFAIVSLGAVLMGAMVRVFGGYRFRRMRALPLLLAIGFLALGSTFVILRAVLIYSGLDGAQVDTWLTPWVLLASTALMLIRVALWYRINTLMRIGRLEHRFVLVGGGASLLPLITEIDRERGKGRRMCGFFDERSDRRSPTIVSGYHKMGEVDDLVEFARWAKIDTVVVAIPNASEERIQYLLTRLFVLPVDIRVLEGADVPNYSRKRLSNIGPFKLIEIYKRPFSGVSAIQKRIFDIVFASLAIVMLFPVMVVIAGLIKLESRGPVLFMQRRHGFNNKPIQVLKFRSMYDDQCDPTAVKAVRRGDARVTRIGRFIRRASIDELPQFFNVLRGDLSLVGPRPHALAARTGDIIYDDVTQAYSARHKVKPGITGWAQINGWRGEMNSSEKIRARVEHDLYYIEHWSLWLDFKIMLLTPWSLVSTKNAY